MKYYIIYQIGTPPPIPIAYTANKGADNELAHIQGHASKAIPLLQVFPREKSQLCSDRELTP